MLSFHVVPEVALTTTEFEDGEKVATLLEDESVAVWIGSDGEFYVESIKIVDADVETANGVIHVIEGVLVP